MTQQKLAIPIMAFEIEGKEMYPIFVFAKCCLTVHSQSGMAWQECAQQTEKSHSHTNSEVSCQVCVCPASSASIECIFQHMVLYVPTSETVWMQRRQKNW